MNIKFPEHKLMKDENGTFTFDHEEWKKFSEWAVNNDVVWHRCEMTAKGVPLTEEEKLRFLCYHLLKFKIAAEQQSLQLAKMQPIVIQA